MISNEYYSHHGTEHHISGYTRDDGTKVKSYTRSCGSNHTHDVIH